MLLLRASRPEGGLVCLALSFALSGGACRDDAAKDRRSPKRLAALPYLASTPVAEADLGKRGVTIFDPERSAEGLNVYCSEKNAWFELRDMQGTPRHRVELPGWCKLVKVHDPGFLVLHGLPRRRGVEALSRIDRDGSIRWSNHGQFHHDFDVVGGEVLVLGIATSELEHEGETLAFLDNEIVTVELATGGTLRRRSLRPALRPHVSEEALDRLAEATRKGSPGTSGDLFHVNTIEVLSEDSDIGSEGDLLIAARHLDLIGVVDRQAMQLEWRSTLDLEGPHHPQLLDGGNVLVFDNGRRRRWSRIVELDPRSGTVVWSYEDRDEPTFFSATRGSVQPLPNGNLLVAESDRGRWFELTRDEDIVWEYWTEDSRDESTDGGFMRDTTYRTERLFAGALPGPGYRSAWSAATAASAEPAAR